MSELIKPAKQTYFSLQAGRAIAALMVVVHHASGAASDPRFWNCDILRRIFAGFTQGVEYFFVLSGAVIMIAHRADIGRPQATGNYLYKRFRRIFPIYWFVLIPSAVYYIAHPGLGLGYQHNPWAIFSNFALVHIHSMDSMLHPAWTLFHEILFYGVFAALILHRKVGAWIMGAWLGCSLVVWAWPVNHYLSNYLFSPIHLLFVVGMLVAWLLQERRTPVPWLLISAGSLVLVFTLSWPAWNKGWQELSPMPIHLLAGAGAALLIVGIATLEDRGRFVVPRPLKFLGDASYSIYLIHDPLIISLAPVLFRATHSIPGSVGFALVSLSVVGAAAGCVLHVWVERPLLRWLGRANKSFGFASG
jgi:exopolysaccharide production protein ExoZ